MRFIITFAVILSCLSQSAFASTDSLIIQGRILNLTGRLYRQAPAITFSRNNILQPQSELSKQAPLAADGSFRVSLPMLYDKEEIYLDYAGKAFTTFLGSPGTIEITFDGDSLSNAKRLFYFAGVNAETNNQNLTYIKEEIKKLTANPALGNTFYESFWSKSPSEAQALSKQRAELKISALAAVGSGGMIDPVLRLWTQSRAQDEMLQNLFEYALANEYALGKELLDSLTRLSVPPLTAQRVSWASRFGTFADRAVEDKRAASPGRSNSLPVRRMATLINNNSPRLSEEERTQLATISEKGAVEKTEIDFLNRMYAKNEMLLNLLFGYERESRFYGEIFDSTAREFLKARYLPRNFHKYTYSQIKRLNTHIQSTLTVPDFQQSLDEIVKIEVKDSVNVEALINFKDVRPEPTEALPGYFISASSEKGTTWVNRILDTYKGKTIYLIKWNFDDARSREEMEYIGALQAELPTDVIFLFIHVPLEEIFVSGDLVKQYMVRHRLKGTHLFLNTGQAMDLLFRLNPIEPGTFAIIRPNGKFYAKNAPQPSALDKAVRAILEARNK